jgi:hypothetical protein
MRDKVFCQAHTQISGTCYLVCGAITMRFTFTATAINLAWNSRLDFFGSFFNSYFYFNSCYLSPQTRILLMNANSKTI